MSGRVVLVGVLALAVAGALGWKLLAGKTPPVPVAAAPVASAPVAGPHGLSCALQAGGRVSYAGTTRNRITLDMRQLAASLSGGGPVGLGASPPQDQEFTRRWGLDVEVLEVAADGTSVLAARLRDLGIQTARGPAADSALAGDPLLLKLDARCGLVTFGRRASADPVAARNQQSILAPLAFRLPPDPTTTRYETDAFDFTGRYRALSVVAEGAVLAKALAYTRVFADTVTAGGQRGDASTTVEIGHSLLRMVPEAGAWFGSLDHGQKLRFSLRGVAIGGLDADTSVTRDRSAEPWTSGLDPHDPTWTWGLLLEEPAPDTAPSAQAVPEAIRRLSLDEALAALALRVKDRNANPADAVAFIAAWLRAHPEAIPAILDRLRHGKGGLDGRSLAALFHGLATANTPETRAALMQILEGSDFPYGRRVDAAQAMVLLHPPVDGFVDRLIRESHDGPDEFGRGSMKLAVGMFAATHGKTDPELAAMARDEVRKELAGAKDGNDLVQALQSAGNAASDELAPAIVEHLDDRDREARRAAADALVNVSPELSLEPIEKALRNEQDPGVVLQLLDAGRQILLKDQVVPPPALIDEATRRLRAAPSAAEYDQLVKFLGTASRTGSAAATTELEAQFRAEVPKGDARRLKALGQYVHSSWVKP